MLLNIEKYMMMVHGASIGSVQMLPWGSIIQPGHLLCSLSLRMLRTLVPELKALIESAIFFYTAQFMSALTFL